MDATGPIEMKGWSEQRNGEIGGAPRAGRAESGVV